MFDLIREAFNYPSPSRLFLITSSITSFSFAFLQVHLLYEIAIGGRERRIGNDYSWEFAESNNRLGVHRKEKL